MLPLPGKRLLLNVRRLQNGSLHPERNKRSNVASQWSSSRLVKTHRYKPTNKSTALPQLGVCMCARANNKGTLEVQLFFHLYTQETTLKGQKQWR